MEVVEVIKNNKEIIEKLLKHGWHPLFILYRIKERIQTEKNTR